MKKYDIVVIGGGFAGFSAALASARGGAKVLIIEKSNCLGGSAVNCLVTPFMPYWTEVDGERVELAKGIFQEIHKKLEARNAMRGETFSEEELKFLLNDMAEEEGIDLLYHAYIFKAHTDGDKVTAVSLATRSGELKVEAEYFIDATGDAQLAYLAGCPTVLGRESDGLCQPMTLCFRLGNVDVEAFYEHKDELNAIYKQHMLMISRMVNMVGEQGTYWVANNFIWGWLLLPILQLGELIKRETATDESAVKNNSLGYFAITAIVCVIWCITIPIWKPFMLHVLNFSDVDKLFELVMVLLGFYMLYAFQNVFDSTFYGLGKTNYMLFESVVTNTIYYGGAFILYLCGVWQPSLIGIALLFGIGNAFDAIVSLIAYAFLLKRKKIDILNVE